MPVSLQSLRSLRSRGVECRWTDRDALIYALAIGIGADGPRELPYVFEGRGLRTAPTLATTLVNHEFLHDCGWDSGRVVHVGERIAIRSPLPESGRVVVDSRVGAVVDKGAAHGLLVRVDSVARQAGADEPAFTLSRTLLARGDGGTGESEGGDFDAFEMPSGPPDLACALATGRDQALLFRLCGDRNPLHADPAAARRAGFDRPILHGLCTFGIACRAVLRTICEYDHTLITSFEGRFTAPVYPGETLMTEMWQTANIVSFRVTARDRETVVLDGGRCELAA